jgi:hypothetical protein
MRYAAFRKGNEDDLNMADLLALRAGGSQSYMDMVEHLVAAITGQQKWGTAELMVSNRFNEQVTISNELFTILALENYKEKWDYRLQHYDEWKENKDSTAKETRIGEESKAKEEGRCVQFSQTKKVDQFPNPVETKWTMYDKSQHTKKFGGWQQAGIDRHNQLHKQVSNDRNKNKQWDGWFQTYYQQKTKDAGKYLSVDGNEDAEAIVAVNDLFSTDPYGTGGLPGGIPYGAGPPAPDVVSSDALRRYNA